MRRSLRVTRYCEWWLLGDPLYRLFVTTPFCLSHSLLCQAGYAYATQQPGSIPASTYYSPTNNDNILVTGAPPDATYSFIRIDCYIMPDTSTPGTETLFQYIDGKKHWALTSAWAANATADGFSESSVIGAVFTTGTSVTVQDYYEGTFTRLDRLLGDTLDYYWCALMLDSSCVCVSCFDAHEFQACGVCARVCVCVCVCVWVLQVFLPISILVW